MKYLPKVQRLDKASNSRGALLLKTGNFKVIFKIPGGTLLCLVLEPENSGGAQAPAAPPLIQALKFREFNQLQLFSGFTVMTNLFVDKKECLFQSNVNLKGTKGIAQKKPEIVRS